MPKAVEMVEMTHEWAMTKVTRKATRLATIITVISARPVRARHARDRHAASQQGTGARARARGPLAAEAALGGGWLDARARTAAEE